MKVTKKLLKKSYAFLMALVMVIGLSASPVLTTYAEEIEAVEDMVAVEDEEVVEDIASVEETEAIEDIEAAEAAAMASASDATEEAEEGEGEFAWYNDNFFSSYEEATAAVADITAENQAADMADNYLNDAGEVVDVPTFKDESAAAEYLRKCMVERRTTIEFVFDFDYKYYTLSYGEILADNAWEEIFEKAIDDTPNANEGDYLNWNTSKAGGKYYIKEKTDTATYTVNCAYFTTAAQEATVTNKINTLLKTDFKGWESRTDVSNAYNVYWWLINHFDIASTNNNLDATTYAGLVNGKVLYPAYASTAYRLLKEMGVSSRIVETSDQYTWNIVGINGKYYEFDAHYGEIIYTATKNKTKAENYLLVSNSFMKDTDYGLVKKSMHTKTYDYTNSKFTARYPLATEDFLVFDPVAEQAIVVTNPTVSVNYRTHVQREGWQAWKSNGAMSGTSGKALRLEGIEIKLSGHAGLNLGIEYKTHIQSYGWEADWKAEGTMSGTSGEAKRLEAIKIRLKGADAALYDIYYRVHAQSYGWLGWAKNGEEAGTAGQGKRLEGIEIKVVKKGTVPSGIIGYSYIEYGKSAEQNSEITGLVNYRTHVQSYGWQGYVYDGSLSGTFGEGKRLESINISLGNTGYSGGITYRTHIQSIGWQAWKSNGAMSGTSGQAKRLEAIEIKLTGEVANHYDVYYRVHAQSYGWLDWAKNGQSAGTAGYGKRLESIQIVLLPKGSAAPGATARPYVSK